MSELLWIAIPGGIIRSGESRQAVLRVLIVPRLEGSSLSSEGMQSWPPQSLVEATLGVDFGKTVDGDLHTVKLPPPHIQAQPGLWEAFFGPNTVVRPARSRGGAAPEVEVDNTSVKASAIKTTFEQAARTRITLDPATRSAFDQVVREQLQANWTGDSPPSRRTGTPPPSGRAVELPDFHRTVSMLREHPAVLRALGLIIELRLPESQLPTGFFRGVVQVRWPGAPQPPALPEIVSPWTQYEFDGRRFLPVSTANISAGMVTLTGDGTGPTGDGDRRWEVFTVDVDGGAQRLRDAARAIVTPANGGDAPEAGIHPANRNRPATLPALRTAGLLLVRRGRQEDFAARRRNSETNARRGSMSDAILTADDLVLGYRIDIQRVGGEWFSLNERQATYRVDGNLIGVEQAAEEGHIKAHAAVREDDGMLRTDEVVARWSGWSLAVLQPALDGQAGTAVPVRRPGLPSGLDWEFTVKKGSLPRLQFANTYRMRARVADSAGGGLSLDDPAADRLATEPVTYRRFEPVISPGLVLPEGLALERLGPAESVNQVVIRSEREESIAEFLSQNPRYSSNPGRTLLPPRVPLALAEQHPGALDGDPAHTLELLQRAMVPPGGVGTPFSGDTSLPDPAAGGITAFPRHEPGGVEAEMASQEFTEAWPDLNPKQLELIEPQPGSNPVEWREDRLIVSLAPAEQMTLELSTFLRGDFLDHFAVKELLPGESETAALLGRHPMVTPGRVVNLVHAVRRPLLTPDPNDRLVPQRDEGQTFAILDPQPVLLKDLKIDPKSTAKVEITAGWTEFNDETITQVVGAPVQSVGIDRGDRTLPEILLHAFGDTRHRTVTYTLTAVSRFRQFFHADEDPDAFLVRSTLQPISVPSSARPTAPIVLSTAPAFRWEQENLDSGDLAGIVIRRRRRSGLRVELQRPWFQTGEGERLAVIVGKDNQPPPQLQLYLSQAGRDPIWDTPTPNHWLTAQAFPSAAGEPTEAFLEEVGVQVTVVPHEVWFHDGRWYADITLPDVAAASYCPFVQLAVARYQPDSIPDHELSPVVHTEKVQLLPDRTLTVSTLFQGFFDVTLEGLGPDGPQPNRVDVNVEQLVLPAGMPASTVDLAAHEPGGIPAWVPRSSTSGSLGSSILIERPSAEAGPLRVRVREVERIGGGGTPAAQAGSEAELTERTVFTDILTNLP